MILYLVDISSFIFRAFYAIRPLHTPSGEPVNAVFGVASMLARLVDEADPTHLVVAYDSKEPSFRKEVYPEYKANRSAPPEELIPQFDRIEQLVARMQIAGFRKSGVEADDLIATITAQWLQRSPDNQVVIVTGDKDLFQLVDERVKVWDTMNGKHYSPKEVEEKLGVPPALVRDYLGLMGDSSDNIPGVAGIGPKTAVELLKAHGSLKKVIVAAEKGLIPGKRGETLKNSAADALLSLDLATVKSDVELDRAITDSEFSYRFRVNSDCEDFLREMQFNTLLAKWKERVAAKTDGAPTVGPEVAAGAAPLVKDDRFRLVTNEAEFNAVLSAIEKSGEFGFDLETTGLNPRSAEIVGVALCTDLSYGVYIPVAHTGPDAAGQLERKRVLAALKPYLENPKFKKIGQNLKYDFSVLAEQGIMADGIGADTMVADYVLDAEGRHNLETLARKHLDFKILTYAEVCGEGKSEIPFAALPIETAARYSAEDAWIAVKLWQEIRGKLAAEKLMEVYCTIDLPMVQILSKMERAGVCVDTDWLAGLSSEFEKDLAKIETRIAAFAPGDQVINLNSPKQIA
ncbi:MAG: 5'-3' exonuclease H3TH domain-containing protein, partial [Bdellovibrionota bacterium]